MRGLLLTAVALAAACGGSSGGSDPGPGPTPTGFPAFCASALASSARLVADCYHMNPALMQDLGLPCSVTQAAIAKGTIAYHADRANACATALQARTCESLASGPVEVPAACAALLTPTIADGAPCSLSDECVSGFCSSDPMTCPGTCLAPAALGASCIGRPCAEGLACDWSLTRTCVSPGALGAACPCLDGFWCDGSGGAPGVCRAAKTSGACAGNTWGECAPGYACAGAQPTATPPVEGTCTAVAGGGATCGPTTPCGLGYTCAGPAGAMTCTSLPVAGENCGTAPGCIGGYCDRSIAPPVCKAYGVAGEACTSHTQCESLHCNTATHVCNPAHCTP